MIQTSIFSHDNGRVQAEVSLFTPSSGVKEMHACLHLQPGLPFETSWAALQDAVRELTSTAPHGPYRVVWQRLFLSDAPNQLPFTTVGIQTHGACSIIGQCPLNNGKVALWLYAVEAKEAEDIKEQSDETIWTHNGRKHIWSANGERKNGTSHEQTHEIMQQYMERLDSHKANLKDNCIRTWFYVRDIDLHYSGLVKARKALFEANGLTPTTHFIASTGIEGKGTDIHALVHLDAYAITGLQPGQVSYLHAPTHLNPTHEYGVTFERGTAVAYGDRTHLFISGTASINNKGEIVHPYHVAEQTARMWENVQALLAEGGAEAQDIVQATVYLRDASDYAVVRSRLKAQLPHTPMVFVQAPVCRPGWLVEMECIAITDTKHDGLNAY
jgi:hypothetical protein